MSASLLAEQMASYVTLAEAQARAEAEAAAAAEAASEGGEDAKPSRKLPLKLILMAVGGLAVVGGLGGGRDLGVRGLVPVRGRDKDNRAAIRRPRRRNAVAAGAPLPRKTWIRDQL